MEGAVVLVRSPVVSLQQVLVALVVPTVVEVVEVVVYVAPVRLRLEA